MMNVSSTSTEARLAPRALPHSRGKASQRPAFTPVLRSKIGLIRHPTANLAQPNRYRTSGREALAPVLMTAMPSLQPVWRVA